MLSLNIPNSSISTREADLAGTPLTRQKIFQRAKNYLQTCPPALHEENCTKTCFDATLYILDGFDLNENEALILLWEHYNPRCVPPFTEDKLRQIISNASSKCADRGHLVRKLLNPPSNQPIGRRMDATLDCPDTKSKRINTILSWLLPLLDLFHNQRHCFATTIEEIHRTFGLDSSDFGEWLSSRFYKHFNAPLKNTDKKELISTLKARAKYDSPSHAVFTRIAKYAGNVYIDRCSADCQQIRVSADGYEVIEAAVSPVKFQRFPSMLALPIPAKNGSITEFKKFLNVSENHYFLIIACIVKALYGGMSFPVMVVSGAQGTGKTTTTRAIKNLVDPSLVMDSGAPRCEQDAILAAYCSWFQSWDNLSSVRNGLSDTLCRLATGAGFIVRKLYTDSELFFVFLARPLIINGIPDLIKHDDLADRSIAIRLLPMGDNRCTENEYWNAFEAAKPRIFGALLDILAGVIRELPNTVIEGSKPRMLDFAHVGVAVEKVCGWKKGCFMEAFEASRIETSHSVIESSSIGLALVSLAENTENDTSFSTTEIRKRLLEIAKRNGLDIRDKAFSNDRVFKGTIERLNPALSRCYGFVLKWCRAKARNEYRLYREFNPS